MPLPIKTKPAPWSFVSSSTTALPQILATTSVGCRYWILPLTYMHPEDCTLPISKSSPSCPPRSQYTHAPLPATHHCAAVPPPIDSGLTVSTTAPGIQGWQVPFESYAQPHPPPPPKNYIRMFSLHMGTPCTTIALPRHTQALPILVVWMALKPTDVTLDSPPFNWDQESISKIVEDAVAAIGVVFLFCHPIWNAQDVERCTSCVSSKYLVSNRLMFYIFASIQSLIAFLLLSSNSF